VFYIEICYTTEKSVEGKIMNYNEQVKKYLEYCEFRKELDWNTLKAYRIDLKQFFEFTQEDMPEKNKIENYITELHKKYKQKTIKRKIASIKAYYNYLEECEIIEDSPFRKIKVKFKETIILPKIIPREEIESLLNYMYSCEHRNDKEKMYKYWLRDISVIETLFATGARVYEVSNIKLDCINLNTGLIKIMGKGGKERYIQIASAEILNILKKYYKHNSEAIKKSGFFFVNSRGNRYTEYSIRLMLKKYTKLAGIERNITPHMFRHSFATYLIEEGVDVSCVQQILGHSSIKTTQIYIHIAARKQAEILREMHPRKHMNILRAA
jgi:integrase/recombinase XerD